MNRKTLEALGLEKETIDRILDEHHQDLNREKASAQLQKDRAEELRGQLDARNKAYDELKAKPSGGLRFAQIRVREREGRLAGEGGAADLRAQSGGLLQGRGLHGAVHQKGRLFGV